MTYNVKKPMNWEDFKNMPEDLQREYLTWLSLEFGVSAIDLANMFGVYHQTVRNYCAKKKIDLGFARGKRKTEKQRENFEKFLNGEVESHTAAAAEPVVEATVEVEPAHENVAAEETVAEEVPAVNTVEQHAAAKVDEPNDKCACTSVRAATFAVDVRGLFGYELAQKLYDAAASLIPVGTKIRVCIQCSAEEEQL